MRSNFILTLISLALTTPILAQGFGSALDGKLSTTQLPDSPTSLTSITTTLPTATTSITSATHTGAIDAIETTLKGYEAWIGNHAKEAFIIFVVMAGVLVIFTGALVALLIGRCCSRRKYKKTKDVETDGKPLLNPLGDKHSSVPTFTPYQPYQPYDQGHHGY